MYNAHLPPARERAPHVAGPGLALWLYCAATAGANLRTPCRADSDDEAEDLDGDPEARMLNAGEHEKG